MGCTPLFFLVQCTLYVKYIYKVTVCGNGFCMEGFAEAAGSDGY